MMLYLTKKIRQIIAVCAVSLLSVMIVANAQAGVRQTESRTLSNLERERAAMLTAIVNPNLTPADRAHQIALSQRRLMDMERMVIRDDRLLGSKDPRVQQAFSQYDTTFLVHASAEAKQHIVDFWLQQLQLDSQQLLSSKKGRR